jgi:uncharacterized small protein (TIGR04563 family)
VTRSACKATAYLPAGLIAELRDTAARQQRPVSWLVQRAWLLARDEIRAMAAPPPPDEDSGPAVLPEGSTPDSLGDG